MSSRALRQLALAFAITATAAPPVTARASEPQPALTARAGGAHPGACRSRAAKRPDGDRLPWTVSIDTQGGFSDAGSAQITVLSDGTLWAGGCLTHLGAAAFAPVAAAVRDAGDARWAAEYAEPKTFCCDRPSTSMSIDRFQHGKDVFHQLAAFTADDERLPAGFLRLYRAVWTAAGPYSRL